MGEDKKMRCCACGKEFDSEEVFPISLLRESVAKEGKHLYRTWDPNGHICQEHLRYLRAHRIEKLLTLDKGELTGLDEQVVKSLKDHEIIAVNINSKFQKQLTIGEKISDQIAQFGGSWTFILTFLAIILVWMTINVVGVFKQPFDPYPFILLNLFLSCLAAFQAPIIMMSQNRQSEKDRLRADDDYRTNLKAELEIRHIHAKLDQFTKKQWDRLMEIQQIQIDLQEDLLRHNHVVDSHIKRERKEPPQE